MLTIWLTGAAPANAITIGQFQDAADVFRQLDDAGNTGREAFVSAHGTELFHAQTVMEVAHILQEAMFSASDAAARHYDVALICGYDDDDRIDLTVMIGDYKKEMLAEKRLTPGPDMDERFKDIDVAEVLANRLIHKYPCVGAKFLSPQKSKPAHVRKSQPTKSDLKPDTPLAPKNP